MTPYRFTAPLLPALVLLVLPALAGYPWRMPMGNSLTIPLLTALTILYSGLRYPNLLASPLVFFSGLLCDLFTKSPVGFWCLLFLLALLCTRVVNLYIPSRNWFVLAICFCLSALAMTIAGWGVASVYQFSIQPPQTIIDGMLMALLLLPLPILFYLGFDGIFIVKNRKNDHPRFRMSER